MGDVPFSLFRLHQHKRGLNSPAQPPFVRIYLLFTTANVSVYADEAFPFNPTSPIHWFVALGSGANSSGTQL